MAIRPIKIVMTSAVKGITYMKSYPHWDKKTLYEMPTYTMIVSGKNDAGVDSSRNFEVIRFGVLQRNAKSRISVVGLANNQTHTIKAWLPNYSVHSAPSSEDGAWQVLKGFLIHDGPDKPEKDVFGSIGCLEIGGKLGFVTLNTFIISLSGAAGTGRNTKLAAIGKSGKMKITYQKATRPPLKQKP